jgi:hypothetical protein
MKPWVIPMDFFIVRLKFRKRSALKFVSRTIPHSGGYNTPPLGAELGSSPDINRDCPGVHTRDCEDEIIFIKNITI